MATRSSLVSALLSVGALPSIACVGGGKFVVNNLKPQEGNARKRARAQGHTHLLVDHQPLHVAAQPSGAFVDKLTAPRITPRRRQRRTHPRTTLSPSLTATWTLFAHSSEHVRP